MISYISISLCDILKYYVWDILEAHMCDVLVTE